MWEKILHLCSFSLCMTFTDMEKETNEKSDWKTENSLTALVYMAQQQYWQ